MSDWTPAEESAFTEILKINPELDRLEAIRLYRRFGNNLEKALQFAPDARKNNPGPERIQVPILREWADKYRVRVNDSKLESRGRLSVSEDTIHGKFGEIVDDSSYGPVFAVKFIAVPRNANMDRALLNRYRSALAAGFRLKRRYGDAESTFHFNPANDKESKLALKLVGARFRPQRILTSEKREQLRLGMQKVRNAKKPARL